MNVVPSSGVSWGFSASDIFSNSQSMVASVAGFIVLIIAVAFGRRFVGFIKGVFGYKTKNDVSYKYQFTDERGRKWGQSKDGSWEKW